jgi:hypothetical protein
MSRLNKIQIAFLALVVIAAGCTTVKEQVVTGYNYETECLGVGLDGNQTIAACGTGMDGKEAILQSMKNGINDLLFKGTRSNNQECNLKPIVPEVNAKIKYADYFNKFFMNDGEYKNFIMMKPSSNKLATNANKSGTPRILYKTTFHVQRSALIRKLIEDKIIHE